MFNERRYFDPRFQSIPCHQREQLVALAKRIDAGEFADDRRPDLQISLRHVLFYRWLYRTGRLSEGVECYGAARQFAPGLRA